MKNSIKTTFILALLLLFFVPSAFALSEIYGDKIFDPGHLKPTDSELKVSVGDPAPSFSLPSISGDRISLEQYRGKKNVVISFIPAAWTPVCSDQWPGYNLSRPLFDQRDAVLLGISVDNVPTLHAWTKLMGDLWFPVLSDFWPHGSVADSLGVLRSDGVSERALFIIDKQGIIRHIHVSDINVRPKMEIIMNALDELQ